MLLPRWTIQTSLLSRQPSWFSSLNSIPVLLVRSLKLATLKVAQISFGECPFCLNASLQVNAKTSDVHSAPFLPGEGDALCRKCLLWARGGGRGPAVPSHSCTLLFVLTLPLCFGHWPCGGYLLLLARWVQVDLPGAPACLRPGRVFPVPPDSPSPR